MTTTMRNITEQFNSRFQPCKVLLIYRREQERDWTNPYGAKKNTEIYVESYDIGKQGQPVNAHPLTLKEMTALSDVLQTTQELKGGYLKSRGILPNKVLYVNYGANGYAIWYTPPQETTLFFTESLNIPSGKARVPAMVWKATNEKLSVFAIKGKTKPSAETALYHAPYLNIYTGGNVCMGTVKIAIGRDTALEDFMNLWETYFFNSYFSHSINGNSSTQTDTATLWCGLLESGKEFPPDELKKNGLNLKHLIE